MGSLIVSVVGTHCTGKSTLIQALREVPGYFTVDSVTRSSVSPEERRLGKPTIEGQLEILQNISVKMKELLEAWGEEEDKVFVLDRSVVDFMSYTKVFADQGFYTKEEALQVIKKAKKFLTWIHIIFYLAPEIPIVDDGVRSVDPDLRARVDREIKKILFWDNAPKPVIVPIRGSVEERVHEIREWVRLYQEDPTRH